MKINLKSLMFLLPFFGFLCGYVFLFMMMHNQVIIVPNVVGKNVYDALLVLSAKNLGIRLAHERIDDILPEGTIMQQIPMAHSSIKVHQPIFVTVSKQTPRPTAFYTGDQTYEQILKRSEKLSLKLKTVWFQSTFPQNKILGQYPLAGKEITDNTMTVFVSSGKNNLSLVPNFKGQALSAVLEILASRQVGVEFFGLQPSLQSGNIDSYIIKDQQPMAGSIIDLGKALTIYLQVELTRF